MSKRQLIDEIRELNPTATIEFLGQFNEADLAAYLSNLKSASQHKLRIGGWVRRSTGLRKVS
jgi:hypothetical protein